MVVYHSTTGWNGTAITARHTFIVTILLWLGVSVTPFSPSPMSSTAFQIYRHPHSFESTATATTVPSRRSRSHSSLVILWAGKSRKKGPPSPPKKRKIFYKLDEPTTRQLRMGDYVKDALSTIFHHGKIRGVPLDSTVRQLITVVDVHVAPDLRNARVEISIDPLQPTGMSSKKKNVVKIPQRKLTQEEEDEALLGLERQVDIDGSVVLVPKKEERFNNSVEQRKAFVWLMNNVKSIRYALCQRMKHMKICPELHFVQVDVSAEMELMHRLGELDVGDSDVPSGHFDGIDFDASPDDDDWAEDDDDFL